MGLLSLQDRLRGDFLMLLKYLKGNFKEQRNTLSIYTKYKMKKMGLNLDKRVLRQNIIIINIEIGYCP